MDVGNEEHYEKVWEVLYILHNFIVCNGIHLYELDHFAKVSTIILAIKPVKDIKKLINLNIVGSTVGYGLFIIIRKKHRNIFGAN